MFHLWSNSIDSCDVSCWVSIWFEFCCNCVCVCDWIPVCGLAPNKGWPVDPVCGIWVGGGWVIETCYCDCGWPVIVWPVTEIGIHQWAVCEPTFSCGWVYCKWLGSGSIKTERK